MRISDWSSDVCSSDLQEQLGPQPEKPERRRLFPRWFPYAAMLLVLPALGSIYYYLTIDRPAVSSTAMLTEDVAPGGNRATFRLASGRTIDLSPDRHGIVVGNHVAYIDGRAR